jgi:O-methyltransferase
MHITNLLRSYYEYCLKLIKVGGVIAVDNTLWHGSVLDKEDQSPETQAIRALNEKIHKDQRVDITFLCIADGVTLCRKL